MYICAQAGGAPTQNILASAMGSIQESLKSNDWSTRKAASLALAEIASSGASFLGSLKPSCVRSLESCRFDKVKPVRDTVLHALQCWKTLPGSHTPQPSETGSSIKGLYFSSSLNVFFILFNSFNLIMGCWLFVQKITVETTTVI